jgi:hypothetical protein
VILGLALLVPGVVATEAQAYGGRKQIQALDAGAGERVASSGRAAGETRM